MDKLSNKEREKVIFDAFTRTEPNFVGEKVTCNQYDNDPPDFICENKKGWRLGIELVEWLNEHQTRRSREFDNLEKQISKVISSSILQDYIKYHDISIFPKEDIHPIQRDHQKFIKEFIDILINEATSKQSSEEEIYLNNFDQYSTLGKFVNHIRIEKTKLSLGCEFVRGGAYSPEDAVAALLRQIEKKINKKNYVTLKNDLKLNELYLIIYYWRALIWNSPYKGANYDINDIVAYVKNILSKKYTFFDKIFLFIALEPNMWIFKIYP